MSMPTSGSRRNWRSTVPRLSRFALEHLLMLPLGALVALAWVNAAPESYFRFTLPVAFAVNDIAMVFFFAVITKEVVEATAPGGVLHPWRRALLPVVAAVGAAALPALLHAGLVDAFDEPMLAIAWPVTFATDLAVGYFITQTDLRRPASGDSFFSVDRRRLERVWIFCDCCIPSRAGPSSRHRCVGHGAGAEYFRRVAAGARTQLLAVHTRRRRGVVVRAIPGGVGSRAGAGADHAFSAACGTRSRIFCGRAARCHGYAEQIRDMVAISGPGGVVLLRISQRRRSISSAGARNVGLADRADRRQACRNADWDRHCCRRWSSLAESRSARAS